MPVPRSLDERLRNPDLADLLAALMPPHLYPPPGAQSKNLAGYKTVVAPGASDTIFEFQVPTGMRLVLNQIGNNVVGAGFVEGTGDIVWQILDNGQPIEDFENIIGSLGNVALPTFMAPITIEETHTVSFVYENTPASPIVGGSGLVGATLRGWYYNRLQTSEGSWAI